MMVIYEDNRLPRGEIVQISPPLPIQGYVFITVEDGTERAFPVRTDKKVVDVKFKPTGDSPPWDYEDPDADGVFNVITPDSPPR